MNDDFYLRVKLSILYRLKNFIIKFYYNIYYIFNISQFAKINIILDEFHCNGGLRSYIQKYKLISLQNHLNKFKPFKILELGTGSSTGILSLYQKKNKCLISSIDESLLWIENTKKIIKKINKEININFFHLDRVISHISDKVYINYNRENNLQLFKEKYDLIIIDGPSMRVNNIRRKDAICSDIDYLIQFQKDTFVLVDIREATVNHLLKKKNIQLIQLSDHLSKKFNYGKKYYTIFYIN